jgi:hypothetical protein
MRWCTIVTVFISFSAFAQDNVDLKEMVGFGCYYEGQPTKTVANVAKLLKRKNYKALSKLLASGNSGEKYLAVISLQRLADNGEYKLTLAEGDLISKARISEETVSVCSGCSYFEKVPMRIILAQDNFIGSHYWLDSVIKKKKVKGAHLKLSLSQVPCQTLIVFCTPPLNYATHHKNNKQNETSNFISASIFMDYHTIILAGVQTGFAG